MPLNARNVFNATVVAAVATIELACALLAPQYPLPCALVGAFTGAWATYLRLPISLNPPPPPTEDGTQ